jgi:CheY-like chemotaxis protein
MSEKFWDRKAHRTGRVLIADDDADTVASLGLLLTTLGYDVRTAANGNEAVAVAAQFHPDAAVLDVAMPSLGGCETARRIRSAELGWATLLIALTGWGRPEDYERTRAAGIDYHLLKPADPEFLATLLTRGRRVARPHKHG